MSRIIWPTVLVIAVCLSLFPRDAAAQTRVYIPCPSGPPCSTDVYGHIDAYGTARLPWVVSVIAPAGVCLDAFVISSDSGQYMLGSVIAPDGRVFRTTNSPLFVSPTIAGWYTLQFDTPPPGREQIFDVRMYFFPPGGCVSTPGR
jgi:hypothetical protein